MDGNQLMLLPLFLSVFMNSPSTHATTADRSTAAGTIRVQGGGSRQVLQVGGAEIEVDIHLNVSSLETGQVLNWVQRAAEAVSVYYGVFPVRRARVSVVQSPGNSQEIHGTTWGNADGFQGFSKMRLGGGVTKADDAVTSFPGIAQTSKRHYLQGAQ